MRERLTIGRGGILTYSYTTCGGEMSFRFHMLCEVGELYKPWFEEELRARAISVETRKLDEQPWIADFRVKQIRPAERP